MPSDVTDDLQRKLCAARRYFMVKDTPTAAWITPDEERVVTKATESEWVMVRVVEARQLVNAKGDVIATFVGPRAEQEALAARYAIDGQQQQDSATQVITTEPLCLDEGCPQRGTPHVCVNCQTIAPTDDDARDAALLRKLLRHLECDGFAHWLPGWAIKEHSKESNDMPAPTMDEFRAELQRRFDQAAMKEEL